MTNYKQLLDEVFVISGIIKVEVSVTDGDYNVYNNKKKTLVPLGDIHFLLHSLEY